MTKLQKLRELYCNLDDVTYDFGESVLATGFVILRDYYDNEGICSVNYHENDLVDRLAQSQINRIYNIAYRNAHHDGYDAIITEISEFLYIITGNKY